MKVQGHDVHVVSYHCTFIRGTVSFVKREGEIQMENPIQKRLGKAIKSGGFYDENAKFPTWYVTFNASMWY